MKLTLLNPISYKRGCLNKDTAGGFGTVTMVGSSFRARLLEFVKKIGVRLPITSFGYLAAIFRNAGHQVEYRQKGIPAGDLVIIASSIVDYKTEIKAAKEAREGTGAKIGFIGPFASAKPELFLPHCDFIIKGEPEEAAMKISQGRIPEGIMESGYIEDLDDLPFPDWDAFPIDNFSYFPSLKEKPFLTILSSRGCPMSCGYYCPYPFSQGASWRSRSASNVIREIIYLKERYGMKSLMFRDPIFTFDRDRAKEIAQGLTKNNIEIRWGCETHLDYLDIELLDIFYESGLRTIEAGIESTNPGLLGQIKRSSIGSGHQDKILNYCQKIGIKVSAFYILGLPDDTEKSIEKTISRAKRLNTSGAQFSVLTPYPGTRFYEDVKERINGNDWEDFNGYTPVIDPGGLCPGRLAKLKEKAFISYYYRGRWAGEFFKETAIQC